MTDAADQVSYSDIAFSPSVHAVQEHKGVHWRSGPGGDSAFGGLRPYERDHIQNRDSFYLATVSETGWPYVQHRGGPHGFVRLLDDHTLGWAERLGNRQYISAGNMAATSRVALIFVDYPNRTRLKVYGHATYHPEPSDGLLDALNTHERQVAGAVLVRVAAVDWNCQKFITPRFTAEECAHRG